MRLLAEGNLFYTPQSQVWICAMCDAQYCQKKWRTCAPQVWLQKHIKSRTTKILFDLQDNAGKGCESENELEHVFLKGGIERWALEGQGTSRAEVLHWVVYNGDRALGVERRNHIKTEFSVRAPLMLPNPDKPASHNTHSYTQLLPTGTYLWLLATSVCERCVRYVWLMSQADWEAEFILDHQVSDMESCMPWHAGNLFFHVHLFRLILTCHNVWLVSCQALLFYALHVYARYFLCLIRFKPSVAPLSSVRDSVLKIAFWFFC